MAQAMASIVGLRGSPVVVLGSSLHSSRLNTANTARIAVARSGFRIRARQQISIETETGGRASLGHVDARVGSGPFVQTVFAAGGPPSPSGRLERGEFTAAAAAAAAAAATEVVKVAAICGGLDKNAPERGLIRAAQELAVPGLEIQYVEISPLPILNTDLEIGGLYPDVVNDFRDQILPADSILFSSPEYNYSVSGALKNAIDWASRPPNVMEGKTAVTLSTGADFGGGRSQYHLRQIGVILNLHFINTPELFINAYSSPPPFDSQGNLIDEDIRRSLNDVLISLREFTLRMKTA